MLKLLRRLAAGTMAKSMNSALQRLAEYKKRAEFSEKRVIALEKRIKQYTDNAAAKRKGGESHGR